MYITSRTTEALYVYSPISYMRERVETEGEDILVCVYYPHDRQRPYMYIALFRTYIYIYERRVQRERVERTERVYLRGVLLSIPT